MESLSKFVAGIIAVIALTILPVYYLAVQFDESTRSYVFRAVSQFTDNIEEARAVTLNDYVELITMLDGTGSIYTIDIFLFKSVTDGKFEIDAAVGTGVNGFNVIGYDTIVDELYNGSGSVVLEQGDYCSVKVSSRSESLAAKLKVNFLGVFGHPSIEASSGCSIWGTEGGI